MTNLSLKRHTFLLPSAYLISNGSNLSLVLIIGSILFVKKESEVLNFLTAVIDCDGVLIMPVIIVVILHEFFILNMSILLLDGV